MEFDLEQILQGKCDLKKICSTLENDLETIRKKGIEKEANLIWRKVQLFGIWRDYNRIFFLLQDKNYYEAWCLIEEVLISNKFLLQNFPEEKRNTEFVSSHLIQLQLLFPYKLFISTVMNIKEELCSICNSKITPWSKCIHVPGKIYNGEICLKIVSKFDLIGADIVVNPEHKYAVLFACDNEGNPVDKYDYSLLNVLLKKWETPFQNWVIFREETYLAPPEGIKDEDICPCQISMDKYGNCCRKRPGILTFKFTIKI